MPYAKVGTFSARPSTRRLSVNLPEPLTCYRFELRFLNADGDAIVSGDSGVLITMSPRTGKAATRIAPGIEWIDPTTDGSARRERTESSAQIEFSPIAAYFDGDTRGAPVSARLATYVGPAPSADTCPVGPSGYRLRGRAVSVLSALKEEAAGNLSIPLAGDGLCRFLRLTVRDGAYRIAISDSSPFYFPAASAPPASPSGPPASQAPSPTPTPVFSFAWVAPAVMSAGSPGSISGLSTTAFEALATGGQPTQWTVRIAQSASTYSYPYQCPAGTDRYLSMWNRLYVPNGWKYVYDSLGGYFSAFATSPTMSFSASLEPRRCYYMWASPIGADGRRMTEKSLRSTPFFVTP